MILSKVEDLGNKHFSNISSNKKHASPISPFPTKPSSMILYECKLSPTPFHPISFITSLALRKSPAKHKAPNKVLQVTTFGLHSNSSIEATILKASSMLFCLHKPFI
ncbi:hypothetical protein V8G54_019520 [Vigna mungo]|uniref:Uncharacterized protein n=1 Tax=Vigna mungo TaxID=3915 RepID=A0AAQ3RSH5_VIGMU